MIGKLLRRAFAVVFIGALASLPVQVTQAATTDQIVQKGTISIGVLTGMPPYTAVDSSGNPDGFLVDLARDVAADLNVKLDVVPVNNSSRAAALQSGRVDLLIA